MKNEELRMKNLLTRTARALFLIFYFSFFISTAWGQVDYSNDSLRVVNAEWSTDTLEGFYLRRYHFGEGSLFCSAQNFCLIELPPRSHRRLAFVSDSVLTTVSAFAERANAYAAVNGSYFDMQYGNPVCYLRIDGIDIGENTPSSTDTVNRKYYQYATIVLRDGTRAALPAKCRPRPVLLVPDSSRFWEQHLPDSNIMTAGPMLLVDGATVPQRDDRTFVMHRHNRTALGIRPDGTVLLLVADGRFRHKAEGLTLPELAMVMRWLGCSDAINLDGGGSTTMVVRDDGTRAALPAKNATTKAGDHYGVVNHPSDNRLYDHSGQRPVANAILVL